jgi:hypothetical protein
MGVKTGWVLPAGEWRQRMPEWKMACYLADDGRVYAAAGMLGNESFVTLNAQWDGETALLSGGHAYVPVQWIAANYPDMAEGMNMIDRKVREAVAHAAGD